MIPVILGHVSLRQIRERGDSGAGLAIAGLILGHPALAGYVIVGIMVVVAITGGIVFGAR